MDYTFSHESVNGIYGDVLAPLPGLPPKPVVSMNTPVLPTIPNYVPTSAAATNANQWDWNKILELARQGLALAQQLMANRQAGKYNNSGINPYGNGGFTPPPPVVPPKKDNTMLYVFGGLGLVLLMKNKEK